MVQYPSCLRCSKQASVPALSLAKERPWYTMRGLVIVCEDVGPSECPLWLHVVRLTTLSWGESRPHDEE